MSILKINTKHYDPKSEIWEWSVICEVDGKPIYSPKFILHATWELSDAEVLENAMHDPNLSED